MTEIEPTLIDGFGPCPVMRPDTAAELGDMVRQAARDGKTLYPMGGRTALGLGLRPSRAGIAVDLRGLSQIVDYPARDMTVTVQAGISIATLQNLLRPENQRLPIDVPLPEQATLGGAIAVNASGSHRYGFGTFRDYVIGITVINDQGHETKAGGRVVKNVAGYDLCKLYVGSLGTLGIITQVTLKLKPLPEEQALVLLPTDADQVAGLLDQVHRSRTRPVIFDLLNRAAIGYINQRGGSVLPDAAWVVLVGYEDNREAVGWQVQELIKELSAGTGPGLEARIGVAVEPVAKGMADLAACRDAAMEIKANVRPNDSAHFCLAMAKSADDWLIHAHAGSGIVRGYVIAPWSLERARIQMQSLHEQGGSEGNVIVSRCSPDWKKDLAVWGKPRGDAWLMRAIKEKLDPHGLFNPGRFLAGI